MRYEEIIVTLEGSGYLFLLFAWRTRAMTAAMSMQNWKIPSHVTSIPVTPSRLRLGAKKHHPRKNRGEPPTGVLPAAPETAYHKIRQIARAAPRNCVFESQPPFCPTSAVPKMGNTYSIPPFSEL